MFYLSASKPSSHQVRDREAWHAAVHGITRVRQDLAAKQQSHQAHKYNTLSIQVALMVKNLAVNAGDAGSIPESGRSPGGGNSNPLQYSCLENPMDRAGKLQYIGLHRIGHDWRDLTWMHTWFQDMIQGYNKSTRRDDSATRWICLFVCFLIFYFVLEYSWLTNNVVIASGEQQRDLAIRIHVSILPNPPSN